MKCVLDDSVDMIPKPAFVQRSYIEKKLFKLGAFLQLPYQFLKQGVCAMDINQWHLPEHKLSRTIYKSWTKRIPTALIKEIKLNLKVGFTAVLVSAISGSLRKMMIRHNVKVPERMNAIVPLPWPKHPKKFCNHWYVHHNSNIILVYKKCSNLIKIFCNCTGPLVFWSFLLDSQTPCGDSTVFKTISRA